MNLEIIHKLLLELMIKFDKICKENNIHYTLHGGSLLGAIREHGFIPWDDDIDIAMTREEYKKLQQVLKGHEKYYIYGDIKKQFRIVNETSIWIDIFICDYIGSGVARKLKLFSLTALDVMNRDKNSMKLSDINKYSKKKQLAFKLLYLIGKLIPKKIKVSLYNDIAEKRWLGDKLKMHRSNDQYKGRSEDFPGEWMNQYELVLFENRRFSIMKNYHNMLLKCYGDNYMTPIQDTRNKDIHNLVRTLEKEI